MTDECCGGNECTHNHKEFWGWWKSKAETDTEPTFTLKEVLELLESVKEFNAGAIDQYLTKHVDKVLKARLDEKQS